MLLPCGIDVFSGVEFVCCPKKTNADKKEKLISSSWPSDLKLQKIDKSDDDDDDEEDEYYDDEDDDWLDDDDDDEYDDDYYDDDDYLEETTTTTTTTTTQRPTADPYFTHYDPKEDHGAYRKAEQRFEERHRGKVSQVMKDWSDLEEKYQGMREKDWSDLEEKYQ